MRTGISTLLGLAAIVACAARADAQDTRTETRTRIVIADDIVREVMRAVDQLVNVDLNEQIQTAIRTASRADITVPELRAWTATRQNRNRDFPATQEARETKTLKLGTAGTLELRTIGGDTTVTAGSGPDTTVEIIRVSHGRTDSDAKLGLERVQAQVDQRGDRATVSVDYPGENRPPYSVSVSYVVKTPASTRLNISALGGNISVTDVKGDMTTSTHGGNTTITNAHGVAAKSLGGTMKLTNIETDGTLQVETLGGDIDLRSVKAKRIQASTVGGHVIAMDVTSEGADLGTMGGDVTLSGPLARSGRYELHTNGGNVTFMPSGNVGYELTASTFAGEIRTEGVTLQVQGSVTGRGPNKSLRGTSGDGSAVVILRTLSGNVTVGKK